MKLSGKDTKYYGMSTSYYGSFKGVDYEIKQSQKAEEETISLSYYLYIALHRIPCPRDSDSFWLKGDYRYVGNHAQGRYIFYDTSRHPVLRKISMERERRCGKSVIKYEKIRRSFGNYEIIKIGCDYKGNEEDIQATVEKSIESFLNLVPQYEDVGWEHEIILGLGKQMPVFRKT